MSEEIILEEATQDATLSETTTEEAEDLSDTDTISELNAKIASLNEELNAYRLASERQEKIANQLNEFSDLFPDIAIKAIPDEVWESVKQGNTLAAAYAVYERRVTEAAKRIEQINAKNAANAAGVAGKNLTQEFFSADDVRKMSPSEVRANFAKIKRSMQKWN